MYAIDGRGEQTFAKGRAFDAEINARPRVYLCTRLART